MYASIVPENNALEIPSNASPNTKAQNPYAAAIVTYPASASDAPPIIASVAGYELTDAEKYWLEKNQPAGISFFHNNIKSKKQLQQLIKQIKEVTGTIKCCFMLTKKADKSVVGSDMMNL